MILLQRVNVGCTYANSGGQGPRMDRHVKVPANMSALHNHDKCTKASMWGALELASLFPLLAFASLSPFSFDLGVIHLRSYHLVNIFTLFLFHAWEGIYAYIQCKSVQCEQLAALADCRSVCLYAYMHAYVRDAYIRDARAYKHYRASCGSPSKAQ
jgi:hypothetical protein